MAENKVEFTINIGGNAYTGIAQIDNALGKLNVTAKHTPKLMERINQAAFKLNNIFMAVNTAVSTVANAFAACVQANQAEQEEEAKANAKANK